MATVAFKRKSKGREKSANSGGTSPTRGTARNTSVSLGRPNTVGQLYDVFRRGNAQLINSDGGSQPLPAAPDSFLTELIAQLNRGKSVTIVRNQATLTTLEAASMLGVSRQFLVNLLEKGEIAFHMVGTHRRIYAQDLLLYKAKRDKGRHKLLRGLAIAEAKEGLYRLDPSSVDAE